MGRDRDPALEITALSASDIDRILEVITAAAVAYRGLIPAESDTVPYMTRQELAAEMREMRFFGAHDDGFAGVIGIQEQADVTLIRHLYVRPDAQRAGVGTALLETGIDEAAHDIILVGTWKTAEWAVAFYTTFGFEFLGTDTTRLATYWDIPDHQLNASVVLRYEK